MNPLTADVAPKAPNTDRNGVPFAEYLREITLRDGRPPAAAEAPVHVTQHVLFDGVLAPCRLDIENITIDSSRHDATIVTLHVLSDDVQVGYLTDDDTYVPHLIGGRHVLSPIGEGWAWRPVDPEIPDGYIECHVMVARVVVG